ncbi:O-antigen ligase family protein [Geomonas agri]|uniref:O-antigen ligase family protein n=1 Tax=Geomonas agri TaxID=2873702 RepID=UPI001CD44D6A|nr:O-antigen ligase family protein [Geomonas agri]
MEQTSTAAFRAGEEKSKGKAMESTYTDSVGSLARAVWQAFRQESIAFWLLCIYLIFEYNKPQSIYPFLAFLPWGKVLLGACFFFSFTDRKALAPHISAVLPMAAFSVAVFLSTMTAYSRAISIDHWVDFFSWVFVVLLISRLVTTKTRMILFMIVYFLVNLKMAQHGFFSWMLRGFSFTGWGVSGSPGWFQNSGEFSMEMAVFIPLVLSYIAAFRETWSRQFRVLFYCILVMAVSSIMACNSRGGIVGLVAVGLWGGIYSRQRVKAIICLAVAGYMIYTFLPPQFKARFETAGEDKTSVLRLTYWSYGLQAVREHPLTGVGFKNWVVWATANRPEIIGLSASDKQAEVIHNTYLEAATELGGGGAAVYLLIQLQIFLMNRYAARKAAIAGQRFLEVTAVGFTGSLFAYMVCSYFMSVLYYPYIWILLALTVCLSRICDASSLPEAVKPDVEVVKC